MQRNIPSDELYEACTDDQEFWIKKHYKGWEQIVRPLIERSVEKNHEIQQIKAKMGSLRFYWSPFKKGGLLRSKDPKMIDMVAQATVRSFHICTNCGLDDYESVKMGYCDLCKDGWFDRMVKEELGDE